MLNISCSAESNKFFQAIMIQEPFY